MTKKYLQVIASFTLSLCIAHPAFSADTINPATVFQATGSDGKVYDCAQVGDEYKSGKQSKKDPTKFNTNTERSKKKRKASKKASGSKAVKLMKKSKNLRKSAKIGDLACASGSSNGNELCDSDGNITDAGKAAYGIPSHLSANTSAGRSYHESNCQDCHSEKRNRTFSELREAIAADPMFFSESDVPDADLANLTVFLNRFTCF